jgi:hypothetical protein
MPEEEAQGFAASGVSRPRISLRLCGRRRGPCPPARGVPQPELQPEDPWGIVQARPAGQRVRTNVASTPVVHQGYKRLKITNVGAQRRPGVNHETASSRNYFAPPRNRLRIFATMVNSGSTTFEISYSIP